MATRPDVLIWIETEAELLDLVHRKVEESIHLDYKASDKLNKTDPSRRDLSIDVSAFANSAGGTLIYGVSELRPSPGAPLPDQVDEGSDPNEIDASWIEDVLLSRVHPRLEGLRIKPIPLDTERPGRLAFVVAVPSTQNGPHQASDNRYYKRHNLKSMPMEDYEIRDVRNRATSPRIELAVKARNFSAKAGGEQVGLSGVMRNTGPVMANNVYLELDIPDGTMDLQMCRGPFINFYVLDEEGTRYRRMTYHHRDATGALPVFPGTEVELMDGNSLFVYLQLSIEQFSSTVADRSVKWRVFADAAVPSQGSVVLREMFNTARLAQAQGQL